MNNQNLNVINNPSIDRVLFSITFMRQQIRFKEDDGLIYNRNVIVIIVCFIYIQIIGSEVPVPLTLSTCLWRDFVSVALNVTEKLSNE